MADYTPQDYANEYFGGDVTKAQEAISQQEAPYAKKEYTPQDYADEYFDGDLGKAKLAIESQQPQPKHSALYETGVALEHSALESGKMLAGAGRFVSKHLLETGYPGEHEAMEKVIPWDAINAHAELTAKGWEPDTEGHKGIPKLIINAADSAIPSIETLLAYAFGPIVGTATLAAIFGGGQADETEQELLKLRGEGKISLGDDEITRASLLTAAEQFFPELIETRLGLKALGATAKVFKKPVDDGISGLITQVTNPGVLKPWAKATAAAIGGEAVIEAGEDVATEATMRAYGAPEKGSYGDIAAEGAATVATLTALLSPLGLAGHVRSSQRSKAIDKVLSDPSSAQPAERAMVVDMLHKEATALNIPEADSWRQGAIADIQSGKPIRRTTASGAPVADTAKEAAIDPMKDILRPEATTESAIKAADTAISEPADLTHEMPLITANALDQAIAGAAYTSDERARSADQRALEAAVSGQVEYHPATAETGNVPLYFGVPLRVVDPANLPTADITKELVAGVRTFTVTKSDYEGLTVALGAEGKRLVVYEGNPDLPDGFANATKVPGIVFMAHNPTVSPAAVAFHEADHLMRGTALHDAYKQAILANLTPEAMDLARERHGRDLTDDVLYDEIGADIHGDAMTRKGFWDKVVNAAATQIGFGEAHTEAHSFLETLRGTISRAWDAVRGHTFITPSGRPLAELYVKNLSAVHDALAKAIADVAVQRGYAVVSPELEAAKVQPMMAGETAYAPTAPPEEVGLAFAEMAAVHEVTPKAATLIVQARMGTGVLNQLVEDVGSIIHSLTAKAYAGFAGHSEVQAKVARAIRTLTGKFEIEKNINENIKNNAKLMEVDPKTYKKEVHEALKRYAEEYAKFPVYNEAQWLAREAAVAIGERRWKDATKYLKAIKKLAALEPAEYHAKALEFKTAAGELISYETPAEELAPALKEAEKLEKEQAAASKRLVKAEPTVPTTPETLLASARHVNQLMAKIRAYPILSGGGTNLKMADELHQTMVENILFLHDMVPENLRARARQWYDGVNRMANDLAAKHGLTTKQVAATIATLSPRKNWFVNLTLAERTISILKEHEHEVWTPEMTAWAQRYAAAAKGLDKTRNGIARTALFLEGQALSDLSDEGAATFVRVFDETYHERAHRIATPEGGFTDYARVTVSDQQDLFQPVIGDRISTAWADWNRIVLAVAVIRDGSAENIEKALGKGDKVGNFYKNIMNPYSAEGDVTIDTHALAAAQMRALSGFDPEVVDLFNRANLYDIVAEAYRDAAGRRKVLPREMQSITWEAVRALFPSSTKDVLKPKVDAIWMEFRRKKITQQQARERIFLLSGGMRKFMWQDGGQGTFISDGGTSFDQNVHADPEQRVTAASVAHEEFEGAGELVGAIDHLQFSPRQELDAEDKRVAREYDAAPVFDEEARPAWDALKAETDRMYKEIVQKVNVERVTGQPYASAAEMNADIARGNFKVTTDNSQHPLWDVEDNFKFRVVHDYVGHYETGEDFSIGGERAAYEHHLEQLNSDAAKPALQVEIYSQAAAAVSHAGQFQVQKVYLPGKEYVKETPKSREQYERVPYSGMRFSKKGAFLNVGMKTRDGETLTEDEIRNAIERTSVKLIGLTVHPGGVGAKGEAVTESTAVVELNRSLTPVEATRFAVDVRQEAVAQYAEGKGELYGPLARKWRPFNPDFFLTPEGRKLSEPATAPARMITLDHYSRRTGLVRIDPDKYGAGQPGAEIARKTAAEPGTWVDRSYYYRAGSEPEPRFKFQNTYHVSVDESKLFDLAGYEGDVTQGEKHAKDSGYLGAYNSEGADPNAVELFYPTPIEKAPVGKEHVWALKKNNLVAEYHPSKEAALESMRAHREEAAAYGRKANVRVVDLVKEQETIRAEQNPDLRFSQATATLNPGWPKSAKWAVTPPGNMDKVIRVLQDKNIDIARVVEAVKRSGGALPDDANPVLKEEMYHKRTEKAIEDAKTDELMPLLEALRLHNVTLEQLDDALVARHVVQDKVNARLEAMNPNMANNDALSGMSDADAKAILNGLNMQKFAPIFARVDAIINKTRSLMVDYGLETPASINRMRKTYTAYVPLRREGHEEEGYATGTGRSVRGTVLKSRLGSEAPVASVISNVMQAREQVVVRGEKNKVSTAMAGLLMLHPNEDIATLAKPAPIEVINPATGLPEVIPGDITTKAGVQYQVPRVRALDAKTGTVKFYPDPRYKGRDNVVNFRVQGQDYAIVFNEDNDRAMEISKAFKDLDTPPLTGLMAAIAPYTRYLASINTQYNPIFGVINFVRDSQYAMLTLTNTPLQGKQSEVLRAAISSLGGIYADARAIRNGNHPSSASSALYARFEHVGGPTGYRDIFRTTKDRMKEIERMLNPKDWADIRTPGDFSSKMEHTALFEWLSDYNETMENAMRLGVFKVATDMGISDIQAASYAKNITVNFNRKGQIGAQMGSLYAFFNANVQGTARILQTLFEPGKIGVLSAAGKKIVTGGILVGVLQTIALSLSGFDPDDIPEFVKQRALVFPIPGTDKGYVTIPMPLGFNILPTAGRLVAETLYDYMTKGYAHPIDNAYKLIGAFLNASMPTGGSSSLIQELSPTVTDPFLALEENTDWTGKPIYREDINKLAPTPGFTRMRDNATIWSQVISRGLNYLTGGTEYTPGAISPTPDAIDYLIASATGGVGREISKAVSTAQSLYTGEESPVYKIPLAGRFIGTASGKEAVREKFYQNVKEANLTFEELKGRIKAGAANAEQWRLSHPEAGLAQSATAMERQIADLRKEKRRLVSTGASRELVRLRDDQIAGIMTQFNDAYDRIVHPAR